MLLSSGTTEFETPCFIYVGVTYHDFYLYRNNRTFFKHSASCLLTALTLLILKRQTGQITVKLVVAYFRQRPESTPQKRVEMGKFALMA